MAKRNKILDKILRGMADANIGFADLCHLLISLGFDERIRGEHHIFTKDEDQAFIAEVPELPGRMADGSNAQEALANAETIALEWIDTARELGRAIPEPKGKLIYA